MDCKFGSVFVMVMAWTAAVVFSVAATETTMADRPPNVLIILADDLGWGDIGCYGNTTLRTPNIDRLAQEGALYTHAIAAASICTPSRAAILTGRYPIRTGLTTSGVARVVPFLASSGGLRPQEVTFAQLAQQRNYSTALMGKWHLGLHCISPFDYCHHPLKHGFDTFYGLPWTNSRDLGGDEVVVDARLPQLRTSLITIIFASIITVCWLRASVKKVIPFLLVFIIVGGIVVPGTIYFAVSNLRLLNGVIMRNYTVVEQPARLEGIHKRFVQEAQDFIRIQVDIQKPFVMLLAFTHSHTALKPTPQFRGQSKHGLYGDIVEELDSGVGMMLDFLDQQGIAKDTFILFTSDQGAHLEEVGIDGSRQGGYNGLLKGGKGMGGMEGGIRVPMLVRWPRRVPPGLEIRETVSLMDIFPTVASLVGSPVPVSIDGEDLLPSLTKKKPQETEQRFLAHYCGTSIHAARWAVNETHVWKAVFATPNWLPNTTTCQFLCSCQNKHVTFHDPPIMYNVAEDATESHAIAVNTREYQEALRVIREQIQKLRQSIQPVENQLAWWKAIWLPWLQPCCNFPLCRCTEEKYHLI